MEIEPVKDVVFVTVAWGALYYLMMQMGPAPYVSVDCPPAACRAGSGQGALSLRAGQTSLSSADGSHSLIHLTLWSLASWTLASGGWLEVTAINRFAWASAPSATCTNRA